MALKTIEKSIELAATIDKILLNKEKVVNGIEINGNRYYFTKASGPVAGLKEGVPVRMVYDHAQDTETNNSVFFIKFIEEEAAGEQTSPTKTRDTLPGGFVNGNADISREVNINLQSARKDATQYVCTVATITKKAPTIKDIKDALPRFYNMANQFPEDDVPF